MPWHQECVRDGIGITIDLRNLYDCIPRVAAFQQTDHPFQDFLRYLAIGVQHQNVFTGGGLQTVDCRFTVPKHWFRSLEAMLQISAFTGGFVCVLIEFAVEVEDWLPCRPPGAACRLQRQW